MGDSWLFSCCRYAPLVHRPLARRQVLIKPTRAFGDHIRLPAQQRPESRHSGTAAKVTTGDFAIRSSRRGCRASAISFGLRWYAKGRPHYRGCRLRLADARTLILAVRSGAGCTSRTSSGCVLTGWGCVLRTASASISCSSALVGVEGSVILPLFLFRLRGVPSQALSLQSFVIFPEGFLLCSYSVDAFRLPAR